MSSTQLMTELRLICESIQHIQCDSISFFGETYSVDFGAESPTSVAKNSELSLADVIPLAKRLTRLIYKNAYIRSTEQGLFAKSTSPNPLIESQTDASNQTKVVLRFEDCNATNDGWDNGWRVYHMGSDGRAFVQKGDRTRVARPGTYISSMLPLNGVKIGDEVSLKNFAHLVQPIDSFFHSFGCYLSDQFDEFEKVRFYFNLNPVYAERFFALLSKTLNRYCVPFHFKALVNVRLYTRADSAVLYSAKRHFHFIALLLLEISREIPAAFNDDVPMFCKKLCAGIAVAEDVSDEESFGLHRCRLVSEAIVEAWLKGRDDTQGRMENIEAVFALNGLSLDKAHLNAGSAEFFMPELAGERRA